MQHSSTASPSADAPQRSPATTATPNGSPIAEIARRLGRAPATVKAYVEPATIGLRVDQPS